MKVIIAGGSLAGLSAGLVLHQLGHCVSVFERSAVTDRTHRGAGIVLQKHVVEFFERYNLGSGGEIGVECPQRQYLDREGNIIRTEQYTQRMTSWSVLYSRLLKDFPLERYFPGHQVSGCTKDEGHVVVQLADGSEHKVDMVIGADGARSSIRSQLFPQVSARYAGYAALRGVLAESDLPESLVKTFVGSFTFFHGPGTQILAYLIPGEGGSLSPGQRDLNWVWYWNYSQGAELDAVMTDVKGVRHSNSIAPGQLRAEVWEAQKTIAQENLPPQFATLVCSTAQPFLQLITDLACPSMAIGRVALVGEAAFVPRPHTAAAADQAFSNALGLASSFSADTDAGQVDQVLSQWEDDQIAYGQYLQKIGQERGNRSQFGDPNLILDTATGDVLSMATNV